MATNASHQTASTPPKDEMATHDLSIGHHQLPQGHELRESPGVPWLAFAALAGAALGVFLSLAVLLAINHKQAWPSNGIYSLVQPASCISLILSLTGIFMGYALSEGVSVAWWHQARKDDVSVSTLQTVWQVGSSPVSAVRFWRHCTYVSLAVVFVALLPLNGFVLQGAILTTLDNESTHVDISVPMVRFLDLGFGSSGLPGDNPSAVWGSAWTFIWQQVQNVAGNSFTQYAFFGSPNTFNNPSLASTVSYQTDSVYTAVVEGAGFDASCSQSAIPFELAPTDSKPTNGGYLFSSSVSWNRTRPNEINIDVLWKMGTNCTGNYQVRNCTLRAATVEYPVQFQMAVAGTPYTGPFYSLQRSQNKSPDKTVKILPVYPDEGKDQGYTYYGIAQSLSDTFDSNVTTIDTLFGGGAITVFGQFGPSLLFNYWNNSNYYCGMSFDQGLEDLAFFQAIDSDTLDPIVQGGYDDESLVADPADIILGRLRQAMFLSSVYGGSQILTDVWQYSGSSGLPYPKQHYLQEVSATRTRPLVRYQIRLALWGGSVAITWAVVFAILPTFWGYWRLPRAPGLTPVDIARAFDAPLVKDVPQSIQTEKLVKEGFGERPVHPILEPGNSIPESRNGMREVG